jgi:ribonuclease J
MGEVGRNLTVLEYGDTCIAIDCGLMFPQSDMPGVDLVVPNFSYLQSFAGHMGGYFITHGHEDHMGALPYILPHVPAPVYATRLTRGLIEVKLKEHGLLGQAELVTISAGEIIEVGPFKVEPFRVSHSIPDAVGFAVDTPLGMLVHTAEFKFDLTPVNGEITDIHRLAELGRSGVLVLLSDSTNAERPGHTPSEASVREALERVFQRSHGRIIISTFASNVSRVQEVINQAQRFDRYVGLAGRSMENYTAMARQLGYLHADEGRILPLKQLESLPDRQVVICCTGTQGEPTSALVRMANDDHREVTLKRGDTVVLSASPIPGNEELVHRTLNNLFRRGAQVYYQAITPVHVSGHASREELKLMLRIIAPRYFVPNGGEYRMLVLHGAIARELGMPEEDIFIVENGQVLEFAGHGARRAEEVPGGYVYVDGLSVGDVGNVVLRDRNYLAKDGFLVIVVAIDAQSRELIRPPEVMTRGFVYQRDATDLLSDISDHVQAVVAAAHGAHDVLADEIRERLGAFIYERTKRRPMVLPMVIEV